MKNEDRIVALLAESLKRQDHHTELLNNQSSMLGRVVAAVDNLAEVFNAKFTQVQNHETRITRLENKFIK